MLLVLLVTVAPLVLYLLGARCRRTRRLLAIANRAVFISILLQVAGTGRCSCCVRAMASIHRSTPRACMPPAWPRVRSFFRRWWAEFSPILLYLLLLWRRADLERLLPYAETLDRITYKTICIAFPLLTLMIAAGAYWANRAWGSYWSWDPKEPGRRLHGWCMPAICICASRADGADGAPPTSPSWDSRS